MSRLQGRRALVTGASRGIGRAIALRLAHEGADVAITFRERDRDASDVVAELQSLGVDALALRCDVSRRADVRAAVAGAVDALGGIDILVNNAGLLQQKPFAALTDDDWDRVLAVNLKGTFLCCQEAEEALRAATGAAIVNLASSGGQLGGQLAVHYAASKAGIISLTRSLARVLAPHITVNCVSPGLIETEMTKEEIASPEGDRKVAQILARRTGTVDEVAAAAAFLAGPPGYVTGHTLNVNGGLYLG